MFRRPRRIAAVAQWDEDDHPLPGAGEQHAVGSRRYRFIGPPAGRGKAKEKALGDKLRQQHAILKTELP